MRSTLVVARHFRQVITVVHAPAILNVPTFKTFLSFKIELEIWQMAHKMHFL